MERTAHVAEVAKTYWWLVGSMGICYVETIWGLNSLIPKKHQYAEEVYTNFGYQTRGAQL